MLAGAGLAAQGGLRSTVWTESAGERQVFFRRQRDDPAKRGYDCQTQHP